MAVKALPLRFAGIERKYIDAVKPEEREAALARDPQGEIVYRIEPLSNLALTRLMSRYVFERGEGDNFMFADLEEANDFQIDILRYCLREVKGLEDFALEFGEDKIGKFVNDDSLNRLPRWLYSHVLAIARTTFTLSPEEQKDVDFSQGSSLPISDNAPATSETAPTVVLTEVSG